MITTFLLAAFLLGAQVELGEKTLEVEVVDTDALREKGLSGRDSLPDGTGMLFAYNPPRECSFWMKNMKIPISIGFFNTDKELVQWIDMVPSKDLPTYKSPGPIAYALEVPMGWYRSNKIQIGTKLIVNKSLNR